MKDAVLLELVARWEREAVAPDCEDGSLEAQRGNDIARGRREGLRECADALRMLISIIGYERAPSSVLAQAGMGPLRSLAKGLR